MNADRALHLKSGDVLVAVRSGRASVWEVGQVEFLVQYMAGERCYVMVYEDGDCPEAYRICDQRPLGRINLRNWEPVTRCDQCVIEFSESELYTCLGCGVRQCTGCSFVHGDCRLGLSVVAKRPLRQLTITFTLSRNRKNAAKTYKPRKRSNGKYEADSNNRKDNTRVRRRYRERPDKTDVVLAGTAGPVPGSRV